MLPWSFSFFFLPSFALHDYFKRRKQCNATLFFSPSMLLLLLLDTLLMAEQCRGVAAPIITDTFQGSTMQVAFPSQQVGTISLTPIGTILLKEYNNILSFLLLSDPCGNVNTHYTTDVAIQTIFEVDPVTGAVVQFLSLNTSDTQYLFINTTTTPSSNQQQTFSLELAATSSANLIQNVTFSFTLTSSDNFTLVFGNQFSYIVPAGSLQVRDPFLPYLSLSTTYKDYFKILTLLYCILVVGSFGGSMAVYLAKQSALDGYCNYSSPPFSVSSTIRKERDQSKRNNLCVCKFRCTGTVVLLFVE